MLPGSTVGELSGEAQVTAKDEAGVVVASYEAIPGVGAVLTHPACMCGWGTRRLGTWFVQDKAGSAGV